MKARPGALHRSVGGVLRSGSAGALPGGAAGEPMPLPDEVGQACKMLAGDGGWLERLENHQLPQTPRIHKNLVFTC